MPILEVESSRGRYAVTIAQGALRAVAQHPAVAGRHAVVISTAPVLALWGPAVLDSFAQADAPVVLLHRDGERGKTMRALTALLSGLARVQARRDSVVLALGGGVTGDLAGFAAASYMRGIDIVHLPTTLLAQVDSSIGGKTGVDLPEGKNLAGAIHAPAAVIADPLVTGTLAEREYRAGVYECVKSAIVGDAALFHFLVASQRKIAAREMDTVEELVARTAAVKARIVSADEHENGDRALLNFGHTFGHALESVLRYKTLKHGEAVAWGMLAAITLSERECGLQPGDAVAMRDLVRSFGKLPRFNAGPMAVLQAMRIDKKNRKGSQRFILTRGIGDTHIATADERNVTYALESMLMEAAR